VAIGGPHSLEAPDDLQVSVGPQQFGHPSLGTTGRAHDLTADGGDLTGALFPLVAAFGTEEADEAVCLTSLEGFQGLEPDGTQAVTESGSTSSSSL
jgi:hypothetical protein